MSAIEHLLDEYEREFIIGVFSWFIVPFFILYALLVAAGIGTISFAKLLDEIFAAIRPGDIE